jgi:hypothetical protein
MTKITKITDKAIRKYYGHNGVECRIRIGKDGLIHRHGSPNPTDRSKDFWAIICTHDEAVREMTDRVR